jgi:hypothetical protein
VGDEETMMTVKLAKTSKMPCKSWSLAARETCPGSHVLTGPDKGSLVPACVACYAAKGFYRMPDAKRTRAHNREDWERPEWVTDMVSALEREVEFRWFDSGDVYSVELA